MMVWLIGNLVPIVGRRFAPLLAWALVLLAALLAVREVGVRIYNKGIHAERAAWQQAARNAELARIEARMKAEARDAPVADAARTIIIRNRKELDDAIAALPDRPLSDRQRARADRELRPRP